MTRSRSFRRLVATAFRDRGLAAAGAASLAGLSAAQLGLTWCVKEWVEGPLLAGGGPEGRSLLRAAALLALAIALLLFVSRQCLSRVSRDLLVALRDACAAGVLRARLSAVRRYPQGDLVFRAFGDALQLSTFAEQVVRRLAGDAVLLVGAVVLMAVVAPRLALLALVAAPVVAGLASVLGGAVRRRASRAQAAAGSLAALFSDQVRGLQTIRSHGAVEAEERRFRSEDARQGREALRAEAAISALTSTVFAAAAGGFVAAVAGGSAAVAAGGITPGALLAFCLYAGQTVEPLRRLGEVHGLLQRGLAAADRLYEIVDLPAEEEGGAPGAVEAPPRGELRLEGIRFRYAPDEPLLEGVDLVLAEGATLALAGPSGSGKSTLARILARLEAPSSGRILLGGVDLLALPLAAARRAVLVLEQEPYVFSGSLAENLALGFGPGPDAPSRPRLEEAARRAGLGPLVAALERGLDGAVGEGGRILSGGERQRVAMARAFLSDPALLVLDEATSALDEDSEQLLLGEVDRWRDGRSLLVVAHRRSTLLRAAAVARMDGGRVRAPLPFDPSDTVARDSVHLDPAGERPSNDGTTERFQPSAESA